METKKKHELSLAKRMAISLVCGLVAGLAFMFLREHLNASGRGTDLDHHQQPAVPGYHRRGR